MGRDCSGGAGACEGGNFEVVGREEMLEDEATKVSCGLEEGQCVGIWTGEGILGWKNDAPQR